MEVSYRRDLNKNYMCVEMGNIIGKEYPVRMLEQNGIPEFLPFQMRRINGKLYFYYEISSRQPLTQVFESRSMKWNDIEQLLRGIGDGIEHAQQYLLREEDLLLDPEYIYLNVETGQCGFCCMPFGKVTGKSTFLRLAEFVLKKLDHGDRRAVDLGYELFAQASLEQIGVQESVQKLLQKNQETEEWKKYGETFLSEKNVSEETKFEDFKEEDWEDLSEGVKPRLPDKRNALLKGRKRNEKEQLGQKRHQAKGKFSWKRIFIIAGVLVFLILLFAGIVYLGKLDLTQIGGLVFLFLAVIWILYSALDGRKEKKKTHWLEEEEIQEEEFERNLLEDLYLEQTKTFYEKEDEKDVCGETRCLTELENGVGLRLVSLRKSEYGDIVIDREKILVGKKRDQVEVCISKDCISRLHARLERRGEHYYITDLNSTNGTFVNGERLSPNEQRRIIPGDRINLATLRYTVKE